MTVRTLYTLAVAVSLGLTSFSIAETVTPAPKRTVVIANQTLADCVAMRLKKSGVAKGAKFSVATENGIVTLAGTVESKDQAVQIVKQVTDMPGVVKVDASLKVVPNEEIQRAAANDGPPIGAGPVPPGFAMPPMMMGSNEPVPLASPAQPGYDMTGPKLPPYAWPTYAPYPNYSRVGYPEAYPYNAFPYIGPFYPFPKVPLGWRSVKLEWDDGHWYLGRLSTPHDYWRVKFW